MNKHTKHGGRKAMAANIMQKKIKELKSAVREGA
jgi:hypothetical protein